MNIKSFYTRDHDSCAGYGGREGYRYKTVVTVEFDAKVFNKARREHAIGGLVVDVANALYSTYGFTSCYSPQIDTKARAKAGVTTVPFEYFHNNDADAERMNYTGGIKKFHKAYTSPSGGSQIKLDPNN